MKLYNHTLYFIWIEKRICTVENVTLKKKNCTLPTRSDIFVFIKSKPCCSNFYYLPLNYIFHRVLHMGQKQLSHWLEIEANSWHHFPPFHGCEALFMIWCSPWNLMLNSLHSFILHCLGFSRFLIFSHLDQIHEHFESHHLMELHLNFQIHLES